MIYVFLVLDNARRKILHFNVTGRPNAVWTGQQIVEAFPRGTAPKHLIRDNDGIYELEFERRVDAVGIEQIRTAPRSPWQNPYVERVIGSIRRECLDHVIVFNEAHLKRLLQEYIDYYHRSRTHLGLEKDCPEPRDVEPLAEAPSWLSRCLVGCIITHIRSAEIPKRIYVESSYRPSRSDGYSEGTGRPNVGYRE